MLKSLHPQPKQEWSEEDERIRQGLIEMYKNEHLVSVPIGVHAKDIIRFLENLRPHWKPSEEQMEALKCEIKYCYACGMHDRGRELQSLCEHLEKLM